MIPARYEMNYLVVVLNIVHLMVRGLDLILMVRSILY